MIKRTAKTKIIKIKTNKANETTKTKINEIKTKTTKAKGHVNSKIRISIIIFTMRRPREKRASI